MTEVRGSIKIEIIPGDARYVRFLEVWSFYSDVVEDWCDGPKGFICDLESVPLIKGTNPEAGAGHDLVSRKDFKTRKKKITPTKTQAAAIYRELQYYFDQKESGNWFNRSWDWIRRGFKVGVVWAWPGYWHKFPVMATYEEITA